MPAGTIAAAMYGSPMTVIARDTAVSSSMTAQLSTPAARGRRQAGRRRWGPAALPAPAPCTHAAPRQRWHARLQAASWRCQRTAVELLVHPPLVIREAGQQHGRGVGQMEGIAGAVAARQRGGQDAAAARDDQARLRVGGQRQQGRKSWDAGGRGSQGCGAKRALLDK